MIRESYLEVKKNIEYCKAQSPFRQEVQLVAVSKTHPVEDIRTVYEAGQRDFGENKVQELTGKFEQLPSDIRWHMIGHLQTNKVKYIIDKVCLIHSVDSAKLAEVIHKEAQKHQIHMPVLIEVNLAKEPSKSGIFPEDLLSLLQFSSKLDHINVKGLMCIPPASGDREATRNYFRQLRQLSIDINGRNIDNIEANILSMGMSDDYTDAILEGSSIVRVGTGIFGARDYSNSN